MIVNRAHFAAELALLERDLAEMGSRAVEAIEKALEALRSHDAELARSVKEGDAAIDALQASIEDGAARMIATQAPVGRDLRELVSLFKVASELERIGDEAVHLAKAASRVTKRPLPLRLAGLERMAASCAAITRASVAAFLAKDGAMSHEAAAMDRGIDEERRAFVVEMLELMKERPEELSAASKLIGTSGFLERLGDHATNICEAVFFVVEGRHEELND